MTRHHVRCDYCQGQAHLVTGKVLYPHRSDLFDRFFWYCEPCDAYVGCHAKNKGHGDGTVPLGRLANAELRRARGKAHTAFDAIWMSGRMTRTEAYTWLANELDIAPQNCHIGRFDAEMCRAVARIAEQEMRDA